MLNENVSKLLNDQINKEMFSAYLYLDMANYYANEGLLGFQNWFNVQAKEEMDHALMFIEYLQDNDFNVKLSQIDNPSKVYESSLAPLKESLKHEQFVTDSIHSILAEARKHGDYRTEAFLQWFVTEQMEEEKNAKDLITQYQFAKENLYMLDKELLTRTYQAPAVNQ